LGEAPEARFRPQKLVLAPGEALVLISSGVRSAADAAGLRIGEAALGSLLARHLPESAEALKDRLRRLLDQNECPADDLTVLVLKRRMRRG
jgi:serine phosphatase RsbU (regulator of sigma subunit)